MIFVFKDFVVFLNLAERIKSYEESGIVKINLKKNLHQHRHRTYLGHRQHCSMKIDLVVYCLIVDCVTNCGCFAVVVVVAVNLTADHIWAQLFAYVVHVILSLGKYGEEF